MKAEQIKMVNHSLTPAKVPRVKTSSNEGLDKLLPAKLLSKLEASYTNPLILDTVQQISFKALNTVTEVPKEIESTW